MDKYQDALDFIMAEEVYVEYTYGEDETGLNKVELNEIEYLQEQADILQELIDNYAKLEKAFDKSCEELTNADRLLHSYTNGEFIGKDKWKEWLLKNG